MTAALRLRSVRQKLVLMVLVANFFTLIAAGALLLYHDVEENRTRAAASLSTLANILGQGSVTALEFDDPKVASENLAQLRANENIVAAAIYTSKGGLFAHYAQTPARRAEIPRTPRPESAHLEGGELEVVKFITNPQSGTVGSIYLKERYELAGWLRDYLIILGSVMLASLMLGLLISSRLQRWVSKPIHAVSSTALMVMQQRNYQLRAEKSTEDEIGQLADAFNGMLDVLEHEIAERSNAEQVVRKLNAELELRVAERTLRTQEAETANRAKADFLANMSHEIRTPMNAILGLAYLLDQCSVDAEAKDLIRKIRNAGRSLQSIINDILDFSKIEAGRLEIEHAPFLLSDVLDNLGGIMAASVGEKDLELVISPAPEIGGQLFGDALRLEQVLINLTGNAIKFTSHGAICVMVSLLARDEKSARLCFSVTDTGIGIPLDKQAQIFAPFAQADISTTRRYGGTGLGLTICRHLVSTMGGEIGVNSEPGRGSEFWFIVEFECAPKTIYGAPEMATLNILIADDSEISREMLSLTAQSIGWQATRVDSGKAALDKIHAMAAQHKRYDVLLVDWKMPGMDGLQLATTLREQYKDVDVPIVMMITAFGREELQKQPHIGVVDGILTKPVTGSTLYNGVAAALAHKGRSFIAPQLPVSKRLKRIARVRVLLVDDSEINREVARRILEADGGIVHLANDGADALAWLARNPEAVDIVLMDVQMPVMDGYEATRRLRSLPYGMHLPVIALTAGAFKTQQDAAREAGMNAFVAKPFNVDELMTTIAQLTHCRAEPADIGHAMPLLGRFPVFKSLPGIAVEQGLRSWKEQAVYHKFLLKFADEYRHGVSELARLYAGQDPDAAKAMVHKLKGAASNLALTDITALAREFELLPPGANPQPLLTKLQSAFDIAFASMVLLAVDPLSS